MISVVRLSDPGFAPRVTLTGAVEQAARAAGVTRMGVDAAPSDRFRWRPRCPMWLTRRRTAHPERSRERPWRSRRMVWVSAGVTGPFFL